jgi:hypothetical protein
MRILPIKALGQTPRLRQHPHQRRVALLRSLRCPLREASLFSSHAHSPLGVGACFLDSLSQYCHPFAPSELPDFIATIGSSDFPTLSASSSLFKLVRGCAVPSTLPLGSPWLPYALIVKLDEACDPGWVQPARQCACHTVTCWLLNAIGPFQKRLFRDYFLHSNIASLFPRLLSCLRIKRVVTTAPARLDSGPVASSHPRGTLTR